MCIPTEMDCWLKGGHLAKDRLRWVFRAVNQSAYER